MGIPFDIIARYPLAPYLLWQAIKLRRTALILPEPEGDRAGTVGQGIDLSVLILGDSAAAGVGVAHQTDALSGQLVPRLAREMRVDWRLLAKTGATTQSTLKALDRLEVKRFDVVVISLGVNDVTRGVPVRKWLDLQRTLWDTLKNRFGAGLIIVTGLPPMRHFPVLPPLLKWILGSQTDRFNAALQDAAQATPGMHYLALDMPLDPALLAEDGFHPGPAIYTQWAKEVEAVINTSLAPADQ